MTIYFAVDCVLWDLLVPAPISASLPFIPNKFKVLTVGAGDMAQQLKTLAVLAKD